MNALLIYPEFPDTFWSFKHALKFLGKRAAQPPLGLMTVVALLPKAWNKRLVDANVEPLRDRDLAWADVVLLSAMHIQRESLAAIVERCWARGLRTVVGGPIASSVPADQLKADHVVIGEAESLMSGLARELEQGSAKPVYQALRPHGRLHPAKRHSHRHGRSAAGYARHAALPPPGSGGSDSGCRPRRQYGRQAQLPSQHERDTAAGGLSVGSEENLFLRGLLWTRQALPGPFPGAARRRWCTKDPGSDG
jgi:B12 binding domain